MRKTYTKSFIVAAFMLFATTALHSQTVVNSPFMNSDYFSNLVPKSPHVASLGKYGNGAINFYAGTPETIIPLASISSRDLSLDVTLNYDATGIRTDEISGQTGLKWQLDAGGYVIRQLNGLPDELPSVGYLAMATQTDNFSTITDLKGLISASEKKDKDSQPDEFVVVLNKRSFRFVFDKNRAAQIIPRQNVIVKSTLTANKITEFDITTEDGTVYTFGVNTNAIEERKIETLSLNLRFADKYYFFHTNWGDYDFWFKPNFSFFDKTYGTNEKSIDFYNSKWHLISIKSVTGDNLNFDYTKTGTVSYSSKPAVGRIKPINTNGNFHSSAGSVGPYAGQTFDIGTVALAKFARTTSGSDPFLTTNQLYTAQNELLMPGDHPDYSINPGLWVTGQGINQPYFDPWDRTDSGNGFVNQSLITESVIKLNSITASNKSKITFTYSTTRDDLPGSVRLESLTIKNLNDQTIKSLNLNYSFVDAATDNDFLWLSEALLLSKINSLGVSNTNFYANMVAGSYTASQVSDALLRKYVYEGLKQYNYKRLFLESIDEVYPAGAKITTAQFSYYNRGSLRRRTTPLADLFGYSRSEFDSETPLDLGNGNNAQIINAYIPSSKMTTNIISRFPEWGILNKIVFPTGGSTVFEYPTTGTKGMSPKLSSVKDYDENNTLVQSRDIQYLESAINEMPIFISYQENKFKNTTDWVKRQVLTSYSQNNYILTQGVPESNKTVKVSYNTNVSTGYSGYETYTFTNSVDYSVYQDKAISINKIDDEGYTEYLATTFPFPKNENHDYMRGKILSYSVYDKNDKIVKAVTNDYYLDFALPSVYSFEGGSIIYSISGSKDYRSSKIRYSSQAFLLYTSTEITYSQDGDVTHNLSKTSDFTYDPVSLQLESTKTYNSLTPQNYLYTKTKYPTHPDYSCNCSNSTYESAAISQLVQNHQINAPIEIQNWTYEVSPPKLTSAIVYKYGQQGTSPNLFVKPVKIWGVKQPLLSNAFTSSYVDQSGTLRIEPTMRILHSFDSYDQTYGNLITQTPLNGIPSAYQWSSLYNYSMPEGLLITPGSNAGRQYTFRYAPSIGLTQSIDPNGRTSSYNYDDKNRLHLIRDHDNNILTRYRYHYIGQNEWLTSPISITGCQIKGSPVTLFSYESPAFGDYGQSVCTWDFGDGTSTATGSSVDHTYSNVGTYTVILKKSNPEEYANDKTLQVVIQQGLSSISICADGPIEKDICGAEAPSFGNCTVTNNQPNSPTVLKATANGLATSYSWQQYSATGVWQSFGGTTTQQQVSLNGNTPHTIKIRCIGYDVCGNQVISNTYLLDMYDSEGCTGGGGGVR